MIELFPQISEKLRKEAELAWVLARNNKTPEDVAKMLDTYTNYACTIHREEGLREFLQFFFKVKMEELKHENDSDKR